LAERVADVGGDHSGVGEINLIEDDECVEAGQELVEGLDDGVLDLERGGGPVLEIESAEFFGGRVGSHDYRFGVTERASVRGGEEGIGVDTGELGEGLPELMAFGVVAGEADGMEGTDAEGDEVIEYGAGGSGLGAHACDVMDGQPGFEGGLLPGGVDLEVPVEAKIAENRDAEVGVAGGDLLESRAVHGVSLLPAAVSR
jgi:hypothetical protein